jgi:translation initiation factor IF-3
LSSRTAPCKLVSVVQRSNGNYVGGIDSLAGRDFSSKSTLKMSSSPQQFNRGSRPTAPPPPMNQYIRADRVRLLVPGNDTGEEVMLGIFSLADALLEAEKYQMDLVMINDKGDPPVCKVIDYGKYKYSLEKKKKENMKKQVNVDIKEVKMSYKIDQHDFDVRMRAVKKFLGEGDKVNICYFVCVYRHND